MTTPTSPKQPSNHLASSASWESTVLGFLSRQLLQGPPRLSSPPSPSELNGQTALITGANAGLGYEAGRQLLARGLSRLIIAGRSPTRCEAAAETLRREFSPSSSSSSSSPSIEVWLLDMSSYPSILDFAQRCSGEFLHGGNKDGGGRSSKNNRLDMVLLNAGIAAPEEAQEKNSDTGHEVTFQINYLSTAMVALMLVPVLQGQEKLKGRRDPVLTLVSSDTSYWSTVDVTSFSPFPSDNNKLIAQFDEDPTYFGMKAYSGSKLLLNMFVAELAEQLGGTEGGGILVQAVNPGLCGGTEFGQSRKSSGEEDGGGKSLLTRLGRFMFSVIAKLVGRTTAAGADIYLNALLTQGEESHGKFVSDWAVKPFPAVMYTEQGRKAQKKLWDETLEELQFAGAHDIALNMKKRA